MEIEAKFIAPDRATLERLMQIERLAGFLLSPARLKSMHDQYMDTAGGRFLRGGFACRVRVDGSGDRLLTLKSLTPPQGLMHVRQEFEVRLKPQASLEMVDWPDCDATSLARQLSGGQPLELLFELRQERYQRLAAGEEGAPLVELSIDHTRFIFPAESDLLGVEAELLPAGDRRTLQAIVDALQQVWGLRPEPISKFERGLAQARPELVPLIYLR